MSDSRSRVLISADDLAARIDTGAGVVLLDIRDEAGVERKGVVPGAIAASLAEDFCGPSSKQAGRRPLPDIAALQARVRSFGVRPDSLVVVYDDNNGSQAARAWWTLRWAGFEGVRLLDGGLGTWRATGRAVADTPAPAPGGGTVALRAGCMPTIEADDAAALARDHLLLDARGRANYVGEPDKAGTGHIPGAVCAPSAAHLDANGRFKATHELRANFTAIGADGSRPMGVYCGSGVAASHALVALAAAGIEAPLYVGSWSAWSADPSRPQARGEEPGR